MQAALSEIVKYFESLQTQLCAGFSKYGGGQFIADQWVRSEGGGGRTCVIQHDSCFESLGINFSHIWGEQLFNSASLHRDLPAAPFHATGVSLVAHPRNPYVPTMHANVRFFCVLSDPVRWWFGGGFDLTPYYPFVEDCVAWHRAAEAACAPFGEDLYPRFKKWADDYFYLPHRKEARGIGGLFFDDFNHLGLDGSFDFVQSVGAHISKAYFPIVEKRHQMVFTEQERAFQLYRRGRYVEFNLLQDRGTLFGLQSGGRTESILMSLPPEVAFRYNYQPAVGSIESQLVDYFLKPRNWLKESLEKCLTEN